MSDAVITTKYFCLAEGNRPLVQISQKPIIWLAVFAVQGAVVVNPLVILSGSTVQVSKNAAMVVAVVRRCLSAVDMKEKLGPPPQVSAMAIISGGVTYTHCTVAVRVKSGYSPVESHT